MTTQDTENQAGGAPITESTAGNDSAPETANAATAGADANSTGDSEAGTPVPVAPSTASAEGNDLAASAAASPADSVQPVSSTAAEGNDTGASASESGVIAPLTAAASSLSVATHIEALRAHKESLPEDHGDRPWIDDLIVYLRNAESFFVSRVIQPIEKAL